MFDLINSRFLTDGINKDRWQSLIKEYKQLLKPGGWLQMIEIRWTFRSQSDHALPGLNAWTDAYEKSLSDMQKDPKITASNLEWFARQAGFERVHKDTRRVLVGNWEPGSYRARIGCKFPGADQIPEDDDDDEDVSVMRYVHDMLKSFALVPFMLDPNRTLQDCMGIVEAAQAELRTPDAGIFFEM